MTTDGAVPSPGRPWVPVADCTLPVADQPRRVADFDDLFTTALRAVQRPAPRGASVRLVLAGDAGLPAAVQRLVDAETACCSFFTFTLARLDRHGGRSPDETVVALDISVPAARTAVLEALVDRAVAALPVTS